MCDDGSADGTYAVAKNTKMHIRKKIVLLKNEGNMKLSCALNRCLEAATGELIAQMDGEDMSPSDRFPKRIAYLSKHLDCYLMGKEMQCFDEMEYHGIRHAVEYPNRMTIRETTPFFMRL